MYNIHSFLLAEDLVIFLVERQSCGRKIDVPMDSVVFITVKIFQVEGMFN